MQSLSPTPASADACTRLTPPPIGQHWPSQGGVYIGICNSGPDQTPQHTIVATAPEADFTGPWGEYGQDVPGAKDRFNGHANTVAMAQAGSEIAKLVLALQIDSHNDFHIPSRAEAALAEAHAPKLFNDDWHWTSTQTSRYSAFVQDFEYGGSVWYSKDFERRVRAFRGLPLDPLNTLAEGPDAKNQPSTSFTPTDIDRLMTEAFFYGRAARSEPYRQGVRNTLTHRLTSGLFPTLPFPQGSAEFDAYYAGVDEGRVIASRVKTDAAGAA